jgi:hypothetical protein
MSDVIHTNTAGWRPTTPSRSGHQDFCHRKKSWLFGDIVDVANGSAVVYSLMLTCRGGCIEPLAH